ncbi:TonB-dependent receptor [Sphingomonas sp. MMSM20]|uniref:TonB-dependent receptor n=1 Tax=Sphingomonas lycopersici TaxID=2951807 RepID=UPI0022387405|nr:TonB-dependent receptor [Sphingomonas lycopersici]MCW6532739.1 TonB-dependent receptor [Sphingomonas lycopersici]
MDKLFWSSALGALATALATPATAQEQPAAAGASAAVPQAAADTARAAPVDHANDADVVVTARRRAERLIDVPVAATVITPAQIRQYDLTSVANIKILAPQVSLDRGFTGSGTSITMRGVSSASLDAGIEQSVLLDFDGMAMSRGRILNDALFDIESVDVLKGPQALFFGKNSPGGVVSIKSADPTRTFSGFVRGGYEFNADTASIEAAVSGPITDKLSARLALFASQSQGYIHNMNNGVPDLLRSAATGSIFVPPAQSRLGAEKKLAGRFTLKYEDGNFDATFKMLVSRYQGQSLQSFDEVMGCPVGRARPGAGAALLDPTGDCKLDDRSSQGWLSPTIINLWPQVKAHDNGRPFSSDDTYLPTLTLNYTAGKIKLTSVTGYYDYAYVSQGNADGTAYSQFWSYSNEKNKSFYEEVRAVTSFDGMFNVAFGGHYEQNKRTLYVGGANGALLPDATTGKFHAYDNEQHNESTAFSGFGQLIVKFSDTLELAGGGRYTWQKNKINSFSTFVNSNAVGILPVGTIINGEKSADNFSPEATLSWHPHRNVLIYGAYKTGYLAGGYSNPGILASTATKDTLSFNAEKVRGFELGTKASLFNGKLTTTLTAFSYKYTGLPLTSLLVLPNGAPVYATQNAASTITRGIEFEASYRPARNTTLRTTASYNDAYFQSFPIAQCYAGQTVATGCIPAAGSIPAHQDLSGKPVYRAPDWVVTAGIVQGFDLSSQYRLTLNADLRYTSGYYTGLNLNPVSFQKGFTLFNAGARIATADDRWALSLIGRNLTNRRYGTLGVDKPGGIGEVFTVAGEPRAVLLQVETRF